MGLKGVLTTADYLPIEEYNRLISSLRKDENYMWELYCRISFYTGLRSSDVLRLKWNMVLGKERITISEKKTSKTRPIKLNAPKQAVIRELYTLLGSPEPNNYLFLNPKTKYHYHIKTVNRVLQEYKFNCRLKIGNFTTHSLRKTFGRAFYESKGRSPEALVLLSYTFKHSNYSDTLRYIGITQGEVDNVYDSLPT